jgi:hypothetical protein
LGTQRLLAGPKGVGKSWVAQIAEREFGVLYLDADVLILGLLANGTSPDPEDGWLVPVQEAVLGALARYPAVSAEITSAWDSDYKLARNVCVPKTRPGPLTCGFAGAAGAVRWISGTVRSTRIARSMMRSTHRSRVCRPGSAIEPFRAVRGISGQEPISRIPAPSGRLAGTATDPIRLRETAMLR